MAAEVPDLVDFAFLPIGVKLRIKLGSGPAATSHLGKLIKSKTFGRTLEVLLPFGIAVV